MYSVSDAYRSESRKTIRNQSLVYVVFKIEDIEAVDSASINTNGEAAISDAFGILSHNNVRYEYATLERNRWLLDGSFDISPEVFLDMEYQGFVSSELSDDRGQYTTAPILEITFPKYYSFVGLTIKFSDIMYDYPTEVWVSAYYDDVEVFRKRYNPDGPTLETDPIPSEEEAYVNGLRIEFSKTRVPYRRVRVESLVLGVILEFDNDNIESLSWNRSCSLISTELPSENTSLKIIDYDKNFSPERPRGVYGYLQSRQSIIVRIGYMLDNGTVEYINAGSVYTTSEFTVDANSSIPILTLNAASTLLTLTEVWNKGIYREEGATLYDLAVEMLDGAEQIHPKYVLHDCLKGIVTKTPLPRDEIRNNLQLIANAGMCVLYTDRDGYVHIEPQNSEVLDYSLSFDDVLTAPLTTKYPVLRSVTTKYRDFFVNSSSKELVNTHVNYPEQTLVEFTYSMSTGHTYVKSSGIEIYDAEFYSEYCRILLSGEGLIIIDGNEITVNENEVKKEYGVVGENCPVENPLITSRSHAEQYADWVAEFELRRNEYEVNDRGYPELDMGDNITIETAFTKETPVQVVSHKIDFNGAIRGTSKFVIRGDVDGQLD